MGEVYRATDTKLGRDVAIKVLPSEMAGDAERLARFQREAHLLASLNHPHIAAIHGLEEADGQPFLVLELVEGEDLKERLERGAIPVDEALEIAEQVAEALEEAHSKGIVHRDLKPANVKVTPDGKVKVLDFGLAKAWAGDAADGKASSASASQSPTLAHSGTQAGVILGTAAYMSPEQARGKPVDKRGDVWAFGVLLWEMLTGRVLFAGDTVTDIIAAVVKEEPDLDTLPEGTSLAVRWLLARCLRKDPRTRLPDIGAARLTLQDVLAGTLEGGGPVEAKGGAAASARTRGLSRQRWIWAGAFLVTAGLAAFFAFVHFTEVPAPGPAARFVVEPPEGWSFSSPAWPVPSPDGRHVVVRLERDDPEGGAASTMLWLRSLESLTARPLAGTEGASFPFWSPDSRFLAFFAEGDLRRLSRTDGTVRRICTLPTRAGVGGDWSEDGAIIFGVEAPGLEPGGLYTVSANGGEARQVMEAEVAHGGTVLVFPQFLPDRRRFLFVSIGEGDEAPGAYVSSLDAPDERRLLVPGVTRLQHAGGQVFFNREGTLLARSFDAERARVSGEPVTVASAVAASSPSGVGWFGVSPGGTLAHLSGEGEGRTQLTWVDRQGKRIGTVGAPGIYEQIALSPDERRVAVEILGDEGMDLWVIDVSRGVARRLTSDPGSEGDPVWAPDSQEVAYRADGNGEYRLYRKGLRGEPAALIPVETGTDPGAMDIPDSWSPDGDFLVIWRFGQTAVWALPLSGSGTAEPVLELGFTLDEPQISPDGRWLAYTSEESGEGDWEVYVQPFRRAGERVRVSVEGGGQPKWRGDGKELFYQAADGQLMAVDVREGTAGPEVSLPTALFAAGPFDPLYDRYGVSADGHRFLVKQPVETTRKLQLHIVVNWTSLLERR